MSGKKCRMFNYDITTNYYVMSIVTLFYNRHIRAFSNACANIRYQALLSLPPPPFETLDSRLGVAITNLPDGHNKHFAVYSYLFDVALLRVSTVLPANRPNNYS